MPEVDILSLKKTAHREGATRFIFNSLSQENIAHVVDLTSNNLHGECSCQHFQMRVKPMIKQGLLDPYSEKARCKHIRAARHLFYEDVIREYVKVNKIEIDDLY